MQKYMKIKRLLVNLKLCSLKRLFKKQLKGSTTIEMQYILRIEDLVTRRVKYKIYTSMDEIVKYVYFDVPLTVPNYTSKNYTLVHKNLSTGKEHMIQLKSGSLTQCEYPKNNI
jgi:hypothetical protein